MSHNPLYDTAQWKKRRAAQLRDEPLCRYCKKDGITTAANVADHIEPHRGDLDLFWYGELQSLCAHHHNSLKQKEERRGPSPPTDESGVVTASLFTGGRVRSLH